MSAPRRRVITINGSGALKYPKEISKNNIGYKTPTNSPKT
jgi:hypothetical protein